mmetsp:Transcript_11860/g.21900  ORF Transcript_11860/g.21900 Transcript_11860/m.21900 type:complete len:344 (-) Transcript_11860:904-1935(-)
MVRGKGGRCSLASWNVNFTVVVDRDMVMAVEDMMDRMVEEEIMGIMEMAMVGRGIITIKIIKDTKMRIDMKVRIIVVTGETITMTNTMEIKDTREMMGLRTRMMVTKETRIVVDRRLQTTKGTMDFRIQTTVPTEMITVMNEVRIVASSLRHVHEVIRVMASLLIHRMEIPTMTDQVPTERMMVMPTTEMTTLAILGMEGRDRFRSNRTSTTPMDLTRKRKAMKKKTMMVIILMLLVAVAALGNFSGRMEIMAMRTIIMMAVKITMDVHRLSSSEQFTFKINIVTVMTMVTIMECLLRMIVHQTRKESISITWNGIKLPKKIIQCHHHFLQLLKMMTMRLMNY